jgi:hypothetical protein
MSKLRMCGALSPLSHIPLLCGAEVQEKFLLLT